jgi:hypothetical protein
MGTKADELERWGDLRRVAFLFGNAREREGNVLRGEKKGPFTNSRYHGCGMEKRKSIRISPHR